MRRRELIMLLGGATVWPLAVRAQRPTVPVIGFLNSRSKFKGEPVATAFRRGLRDAGYEEGRNVAVEYRWAEDQYDRLPALAVDLATRGVAAIVAGGGAWVAAKKATTSIPIIFTTGLDPVRAGMVKSINRPEANLTGVTFYSGGAIIAKQLELLRELVPNVTEVAMLVHPSSPTAESQMQDAVVAARQNGVALHIVNVADTPDLDAAFTAIQANALVIMVDPFFEVGLPKLSRARRVGTCRPCTTFVNLWRQAGSSATVRASSRPIVRLEPMRAAFSPGPSLQTCRSCCQPSSS